MTVGLAGFLAVTVANGIVIAITWIKTLRHVREAFRLGIDVSISTVLLHDGEKSCVTFRLVSD